MTTDSIRIQHMRSSILQFLKDHDHNRLNDSVLLDALNNLFIVSREEMRSELQWLADSRLVVLEKHDTPDLWIVTATDLGLDVGGGRRVHKGVKRPRV